MKIQTSEYKYRTERRSKTEYFSLALCTLCEKKFQFIRVLHCGKAVDEILTCEYRYRTERRS